MKNKELYDKIKVMSNALRFEILELTQDESLTITELSSKLNLTYTACADYVTLLYDVGLVSKTQEGKNVLVRSVIRVDSIQI